MSIRYISIRVNMFRQRDTVMSNSSHHRVTDTDKTILLLDSENRLQILQQLELR